ncbi:MAG TPA: GNAT family N-acetyltransferase [Bacteroidia bacterium]|nr:GNAT family N-acetyltransferase [Bacteroidia bacterium]HNT80551.1 GNAT family N-acetyltransferase [Bacteroidia bacterium]
MVRSPQNTTEWEEYYQLRYKILRKPWNQAAGSEKDEMEQQCIHAACFVKEKIVAVGRLQMNNETQAQIRYMAVDDQHQNKGYGQEIMQWLEDQARLKNAEEIVLESRENAVAFYEKNGYKIISKSYILFDKIQHFTMKKDL